MRLLNAKLNVYLCAKEDRICSNVRMIFLYILINQMKKRKNIQSEKNTVDNKR